MTNSNPLISVCIPSYNRGGILHLCLDSVLAQTYTNIEVVVADNASSDDTPAVLRSYQERDPRVRSFRNPETVTAFANHNVVLAEAKGDYVLILHSDDELVPDALETHLRNLQEHPEAQFSFSSQLWRDFSTRLLDGSRGEVTAVRDEAGEFLYSEHIWDDTYQKIHGRDLEGSQLVDTRELGREILRQKLLCILGNPGNFLVRHDFYRSVLFKETFYHDPFSMNIKMGWANVSEWQLRALFAAERAVYNPSPLLVFKQLVPGGEASITAKAEGTVTQIQLKEWLCDIVLTNEVLRDPVYAPGPALDLTIARGYVRDRADRIAADFVRAFVRRVPERISYGTLTRELNDSIDGLIAASPFQRVAKAAAALVGAKVARVTRLPGSREKQ
jgi:glycosyltransferase involved in cell wall biosynthesis